METITNYVKVARARVIFYIELILFVIQSVLFAAYALLIAANMKKIKQSLDQDKASIYDDSALITGLILIAIYYVVEGSILYILYRGVLQKCTRKLGIWLIANSVVLAFVFITVLIEIIEKRFIGGWPATETVLIFIYKCIAMKIVFDAWQEVRQFPVSVPFVQMRNCEEHV